MRIADDIVGDPEARSWPKNESRAVEKDSPPFRSGSASLLVAFSSRQPVSTSLENALMTCGRFGFKAQAADCRLCWRTGN
jgi:hypothetical protein